MKVPYLMIVVLLASTSSLAADPIPYLKAAPMPFYPPIARHTRIEGRVTVRMTVNSQGETSDVTATADNVLLRWAAADNVKGWRFAWPAPCSCKVEREVLFIYRLTDGQAKTDSPDATVRWYGNSRVEIEADLLPTD